MSSGKRAKLNRDPTFDPEDYEENSELYDIMPKDSNVYNISRNSSQTRKVLPALKVSTRGKNKRSKSNKGSSSESSPTVPIVLPDIGMGRRVDENKQEDQKNNNPLIIIANISTWIFNQIHFSSKDDDSIFNILNNNSTICHEEIYNEVKLLKEKTNLKKRNPKNCSSDKTVAIKFLVSIVRNDLDSSKFKLVADQEVMNQNGQGSSNTQNSHEIADLCQNFKQLLERVDKLEKNNQILTELCRSSFQNFDEIDGGHQFSSPVPSAGLALSHQVLHDQIIDRSNQQQIKRSQKLSVNTKLSIEKIGKSNNKNSNKKSKSSHNLRKIKICAFNIANFGKSKFQKEAILQIILKIMSRFDLIVIQEIRSKNFDVVEQTLQALNKYCRMTGSGRRYKAEQSNFVGNEHREEQYGYFYNTQKLKLDEFRQFEDGSDGEADDLFRYEPAFANFIVKKTNEEFTIIGVHIQKDSVVKEMNNLVDLYDHIVDEFGTENVIFTGDFNAEGSYLRKKDKSDVKLLTDSRFKSLISDEADTTVAKSDEAYDRIFVAGKLFQNVNKGETFRFDKEFGLTPEEAFKVSDHYPIQFQLYCEKKFFK